MGVFSDLIASTDGETRVVLEEVLDRALDLVPEAVEDLSYGTPALRYRGSPLIGGKVSARHLSLYPFSPDVVAAVSSRLRGYSVSKGTIRFSAEQPLPTDVLDDIVELRRAEIDAAK
ncbi:MAG TPA: DUF1801 domain-containing protein [Propionicimonas sp.]|nr:DUF1801 domain-containing protein [Propionicimonas sp.]